MALAVSAFFMPFPVISLLSKKFSGSPSALITSTFVLTVSSDLPYHTLTVCLLTPHFAAKSSSVRFNRFTSYFKSLPSCMLISVCKIIYCPVLKFRYVLITFAIIRKHLHTKVYRND